MHTFKNPREAISFLRSVIASGETLSQEDDAKLDEVMASLQPNVSFKQTKTISIFCDTCKTEAQLIEVEFGFRRVR